MPHDSDPPPGIERDRTLVACLVIIVVIVGLAMAGCLDMRDPAVDWDQDSPDSSAPLTPHYLSGV